MKISGRSGCHLECLRGLEPELGFAPLTKKSLGSGQGQKAIAWELTLVGEINGRVVGFAGDLISASR
jgi:hypothetical protein